MSERSSSRRPNTLGLRASELEAVVRSLQGADSGTRPQDPRRRHTRIPYVKERIHVRLQQPGAAPQVLKMACRNLSSGGVSLLHNAFVHVGSPCAVVLHHRIDGQRVIEGTIVRCTHRAGVLHELGVQFNEPILVAEYLNGVEEDSLLSFENIDHEELEGDILLIESNATDDALVRHYLSHTRLRIRHAGTLEAAADEMERKPDVVILDLHVENDNGSMFLVRRRAEGDNTPVIALTIDTTDHARSLLAALAHVRLLTKPVDQNDLIRSLAEFLLQDLPAVTAGASVETIGANLPLELLEAFRIELDGCIEELEASLSQSDPARCRQACQRLAGSAPSLGLQNLGNLARCVLERLPEETFKNLASQITELIESCKRQRAA